MRMMRAAFVSCLVADAMSILKIIIIRCLPAIGKFSIYMCGVEQYGCCGVVQVPEIDRGEGEIIDLFDRHFDAKLARVY